MLCEMLQTVPNVPLAAMELPSCDSEIKTFSWNFESQN